MSALADHDAAGLRAAGIELIRVCYPDLHGVCRSKDVLAEAFATTRTHGIHQTEAVMTIDLRHSIVSGFEHGFRDFAAIPDVATLAALPNEPGVAWCLADGRDATGAPFALDARGVLRRQIEALEQHGLHPVVGPELEFYLVQREGWEPSVARDSSVYTGGRTADPRGALRAIMRAARDAGLRPLAGTQEYGRGQYEVNLAHSGALDAADRAFRFKALTKEIAAEHDLLATFLGQLRDDDEGSGFHLHVSLVDAGGANRLDDAADPDGISRTARAFGAGVLAHLAAMTALLNPTINAYRRFIPESLAPTHVNWGVGTRLATLRVPPGRGEATRWELRSADGTANPYLAIAAVIAAGRDGIERELALGAPVAENPYEAPETLGAQLPATLAHALDAFEGDAVLRAALGERLCATFVSLKRHELDRFAEHLRRVTTWEREEYAHHL